MHVWTLNSHHDDEMISRIHNSILKNEERGPIRTEEGKVSRQTWYNLPYNKERIGFFPPSLIL